MVYLVLKEDRKLATSRSWVRILKPDTRQNVGDGGKKRNKGSQMGHTKKVLIKNYFSKFCFLRSFGGALPSNTTTLPSFLTGTSWAWPWSSAQWWAGLPRRGAGPSPSQSWPWHLELLLRSPEISQSWFSLVVRSLIEQFRGNREVGGLKSR